MALLRPSPVPMTVDRDQLLLQALAAIETLEAKLDAAEREPIAVVGMGCRFPAGATSLRAYWDALALGRDGVGEIPPERWSRSAIGTDHPGARYAALLEH